MKKKNVVVIGGGTGTFVALKGLKKYPLNLTAVVSMSDSGGSNKRIRDEFGLLPTSDIRSCMVALSDEGGKAGVLRQLFMYRFEKGEGISGMTFGNLFMAALTDILGSQEEALKQTQKVLRISGSVVPVTFTNTHLFAEYENGSVVTEEHFIDEPQHDGTLKITNLYLKPEATANPQARLTL
ncbi:YvcK family protein, partial [Candidatus Microgenomates bacterium]|nr:YvcK family protein [Candidatus Microgenomates bacterium]